METYKSGKRKARNYSLNFVIKLENNIEYKNYLLCNDRWPAMKDGVP